MSETVGGWAPKFRGGETTQETKRASGLGWLSVRVIGGNQQQLGAWMNSKQTGRYFQFPIRALRVGCGLDDVTREQAFGVFDTAMNYSIWQKANELSDDERLDGLADAYFARHPCKVSDDEENEMVQALAAACEVLAVKATLSTKSIKNYNDTWQTIERIPGSNLLVRVRNDLMWEFRDSWAFRDAALLCGVYAGVGDATYKRVTAERIRTLAMGFASGAELKQHGARLPKLTERKVRWTLGKLERRGLFQSATPTKRCTYYSHRLSEREFIEVLAMREKESIQRKTDTKRAAILARAQELLAADAAAAVQTGQR